MASGKTFCRLCFEKCESKFSIFEDEILKMLESLILHKITSNNEIFAFVCTNCLVDLKTAHAIQQRIIKAEEHVEKLSSKLSTGNCDQSELTNNNIEKAPKCSLKYPHKISGENAPFANDLLEDAEKHIEQDAVAETTDNPECELEFLCEQCGEIFTGKENFNEHIVETHTGDYICEHCGKDFFEMTELNQHLKRKHSKFVCDDCHQTFSLRYVLQMHKLQHISDNPYICHFCGRKFKYTITLTVHQRSKHSEKGGLKQQE